jgi:hypothetical protein
MNNSGLALTLQTITVADHVVAKWRKRLSDDTFIELGDDPRLILNIERDFSKISNHIEALENHFSLEKIPLGQANYYFDVVHNFNVLVSTTENIKQKAFGSRSNTHQFIKLLEGCSSSVEKLSYVLMMRMQSQIAS